MKNIEKIQQMSAEELAEFLENSRCCAYNDTDRCDNRSCEQGIAEWLEQEAEKPSIFELEPFDVYYQIDDVGRVIDSVYAGDAIDIELEAIGNVCTDKSVMERKAHDLKLWSLLWNFAEENNKKMDWEDIYQNRYWLQKGVGVWKVMSLITTTRGLEPYFTSEDIAWRAIDEIVLPWERGEL